MLNEVIDDGYSEYAHFCISRNTTFLNITSWVFLEIGRLLQDSTCLLRIDLQSSSLKELLTDSL